MVCGENQVGKHRQHHSAVTCRTSYCVDYSTVCYYYYGYFQLSVCLSEHGRYTLLLLLLLYQLIAWRPLDVRLSWQPRDPTYHNPIEETS